MKVCHEGNPKYWLTISINLSVIHAYSHIQTYNQHSPFYLSDKMSIKATFKISPKYFQLVSTCFIKILQLTINIMLVDILIISPIQYTQYTNANRISEH